MYLKHKLKYKIQRCLDFEGKLQSIMVDVNKKNIVHEREWKTNGLLKIMLQTLALSKHNFVAILCKLSIVM